MHQYAGGAETPRLPHGQDGRAHLARALIAVTCRGGDVSDADLAQSRHVTLLGGATHRIPVPLAHAVPDVHEIEVRIDLDYVDGAVLTEGADAGDINGMVAAEHCGERAPLEDLAHRCLCVGMALCRIRMDHVGIADVDDADLIERQV